MNEITGTEPVAAAELKQFIERIEGLGEKAGITGDLEEVFAELKGGGFFSTPWRVTDQRYQVLGRVRVA